MADKTKVFTVMEPSFKVTMMIGRIVQLSVE